MPFIKGYALPCSDLGQQIQAIVENKLCSFDLPAELFKKSNKVVKKNLPWPSSLNVNSRFSLSFSFFPRRLFLPPYVHPSTLYQLFPIRVLQFFNIIRTPLSSKHYNSAVFGHAFAPSGDLSTLKTWKRLEEKYLSLVLRHIDLTLLLCSSFVFLSNMKLSFFLKM